MKDKTREAIEGMLMEYHCGECLNKEVRSNEAWRKQMNDFVGQLLALIQSEREEAYKKGFTKGRVETAKAMNALNTLEKAIKDA